MMDLIRKINFQDKIVRLAIAFILIVFGAWEVLVPAYWAVFVPEFATAIFNPLFATRIHGLALFVLGALLISGYRKNLVSLASSLVLLSVVVSVFMYSGFSDLLVRDIVIFLCSLSLLFEKKE
ncbi:MAG: hypothetical protein HYU48_00865 [Candidatus Levybacteria bacterium]|nr:hypothetical protein [Candidatus Levybacteria bacterium]